MNILKGAKNWYKSFGVTGATASLAAIVLGAIGIKITGGDITELTTLVPAALTSIGLIVKRVGQTTSGLGLSGWIMVVVGVASGGVTAFGIDVETVNTLTTQLTAISVILFKILSGYGIQVADKKIA